MKRLIYIIIPFLFIQSLFPEEQKTNDEKKAKLLYKQNLKSLNAKYRNVFNMITYIADKHELKVFKQLPTIKDREIYMNLFWEQRDPTPGTKKNEYKIEIEERFKYVNTQFSRSTPKPGWKTDRGKIYMILGKPSTIETFDNVNGLYPARVWYYYGEKNLGLPTYFNITFFKRLGTGDWIIYDPVADGPGSLLAEENLGSTKDYRVLYRQVKNLSSSLAGPAITMIPNQMPFNFKPSPMNSLIMANIYKSPTKKINVSYAADFNNYKGYVSVESSISFIENTHLVYLFKDDSFDGDLIFFSIKPKKISVNYFPDKKKYYFDFHMIVSLKQDERLIYEYSRNFDSYIEEKNLGILESSGVVIHDYLPVLPDKFKLRVFIQNKVGKEFSYFEKEVETPSPKAGVHLASPVPFYKKEYMAKHFFYAYKFKNQKLYVDTEKTFGLGTVPYFLIRVRSVDRQTWKKGKVEWTLSGFNEKTGFKKKGMIFLKEQPYKQDMNIIFQVPHENLQPDYYDLSLQLFDQAENPIGTTSSQFIVSMFKDISRPTEIYHQVPTKNFFYFDYILGLQSHNTGQPHKAEFYLEKSILANPFFNEGIIAFLKTEIELKKFDRVLEDVEKLKNDERSAFDYHKIKGEALFGVGKYREAVKEFLEAYKINTYDVHLINMMGLTFVRLENFEEALKAFEASIRLNDKQPMVRQTIEKLKATISEKK